MVKWKSSDVERITGEKVKPHSRAVKIPKEDPVGLQFIKNHLSLLSIEFEAELMFSSFRKFRFDVAIPDMKVAVEYEGLMSVKSGHTTITGYTKDCDKYNLAQIEGWTVLRYTVTNYKNFPEDLKKIIRNGSN